MKEVSLNARLSGQAATTDDVEVVLIKISHADLDEPVRLSTDPTETISEDPLVYGTYSTFQTGDGSPFLFALVSTVLPGDVAGEPLRAQLTFSTVDVDMLPVLRAVVTQARVDLGVVRAATPNTLDGEFLNLRMIGAKPADGSVTIYLGRKASGSLPWPSGRMTRERAPTLHR